MRIAAVLCIAVLAAGCMAPASVEVAAVGLPGLAAFVDCPVVDGVTVACEPDGDSHVAVDVRAAVPLGWTCLTYADDRFATDERGYPFPDWYTYYGPYLGDGGSGAGEDRMGIYYDTHEDAASVSGALVLFSEDEGRVYTWQGPAAGFVLVPQRISRPDLLAYGVIYPDVGPTKGQFRSDGAPWMVEPGFNVEAAPDVEISPFWTLGQYVPEGNFSIAGGGDPFAWTVVQGTEVAGTGLHFPTAREATVAMGSGDDGLAHWGYGRSAPFNVSIAAEGLTLDASLQPYVEFYAQFHDLSDPIGLASAQFLCGCRDKPLTTVEGLQCAIGLQPFATVTGQGPVANQVSLG